MSRKTFSLRRLRSGVVVFRYGSYIESFDVEVIGPLQTYERNKWAAITAGLQLNQDTLDDLMREAKGLIE